MDFIQELKKLSAKIPKYKDSMENNEQATKNTLIEPFIKHLGYDVSNPTEVRPEFPADIRREKGDKVDYAIFKDNEPVMIIECKPYGTDLSNDPTSQLRSYFTAVEARFAVLTDGGMYQFYTDLEKPNIMDDNPFLEFDIFVDIRQSLVNDLKQFTKPAFDLDKTLATARYLKYSKEIKQIVIEQLKSPRPEFVHFFLSSVSSGGKTQGEVEEFTDIVKRVFNELMSEEIDQQSQPDSEFIPPSKPEPPTSMKNTKLQTFTLEDHEEEVESWADGLVKFCEILFEIHSDEFEKVLKPSFLGRRRKYFSKNPTADFPKDNDPRKIKGTDIFVDTWSDSNTKKRLMEDLANCFECNDCLVKFSSGNDTYVVDLTSNKES